MRYDTMLEKVRDRSGTSLQDAELAIRAVLLTLSERVAAKESADLASQLPLEFKDAFYPGLRPERFGADEFVHRVAGRAGRIDEAISEEVGMAEAGVDGSPAADGAI